MSAQHQQLAAGRWREMTLAEQMANIGSEVGRALNWRRKGQLSMFEKAAGRALELIDLSLAAASSLPHAREIARLQEVLLDDFYGGNEFASSDRLWQTYFDHFAYLARKGQ